MADDRKLKIMARLRRKVAIPANIRHKANWSTTDYRPAGVSPNPCPDAEPLGYLVNMPHEAKFFPLNVTMENKENLTTVPRSYVYPVEIKSAGDMGNGVFVTRDVKKGDLLCYYDGICCFKKEHANIVSGKCGYFQELYGDTFLAGFQTQLRPGGCGQLINDASNDLSTYGDNEYHAKINTSFVMGNSTCLGVFAGRDILRGEQLFHHYGKEYWKDKECGTMDNFDDYIKKTQPKINVGLELNDYCERLRYCSLLRFETVA